MLLNTLSFKGQLGYGSGPPPITSGPTLDANQMIARDLTNGWDLYDKNAGVDPGTSPHSLVKLATALILMDRKGSVLDSESATVVSGDLVAGTSAQLQAGDVLTWHELLFGLIVPSGNDAAETIARVVGDYIQTQDGGATGGKTRFVQEMNLLAGTLEMNDTTFTSPNGYPDANDRSTARDLARLAEAAFNNSTIRAVAATASHTMTITGANARTYAVTHTSELINDDNVLAIKTGGGAASGEFHHCMLWQAPNGNELVLINMNSVLSGDRFMDARCLAYQIVEDFDYLTSGVSVGTDASFASVVLLTGADSGFVDESSVGRTLTSHGNVAASTSSPLVGTASYLFDGVGDYISAADAADLSFSGDFTVEFYMSGPGSEPSAYKAWISKWDTTGNQREWSVQYDYLNNQIVFFVSTTGSDFPAAYFDLDTANITPSAFFNGGKRHILAQRSGTETSVYVNGVKGGSTNTVSGSLFSGTSKLVIGGRESGGTGLEDDYAGQIDEVRVTGGVARQSTAHFTPTGRAYPRTA